MNTWGIVKKSKVFQQHPTAFLMLLGALLVLASWISELAVPSVAQESQAYLGDKAHELLAASQVLQGKLPHKDFFWHYGLLPLYVFAGWCSLCGGVSHTSYVWHHNLLGLAVALLLLFLFCRAAGRTWGFVAWVLTGFGWPFGGGLYAPYERLFVVSIAILWAAPDRRSVWKSWIVGLLLGILQSVKFGSAFVVGFSWLLADCLWLTSLGHAHASWKRWFSQLACILTGFLVVEGMLVAHAFATLPEGLAEDSILPLFHMEWYDSYANGAMRWPRFENWGFFAGLQFPMILGALGLIFAVLGISVNRFISAPRELCRKQIAERTIPIVIFGLFYLTAIWVGYFRHAMHFYGYAWLLGGGVSALFASIKSRFLNFLLVFLLAPSGALIPLGAWRLLSGERSVAPNLVPFEMSNGQKLWLTPQMGKGITTVVQKLAIMQTRQNDLPEKAQKKGFVVLSTGSALHFYGQLPMACRHCWFFPGVVRQYERSSILEQMLDAHAIVVRMTPEETAKISSERASWKYASWCPFKHEPWDKRLFDSLAQPQVLEDGWVIFPVSPQGVNKS